MEGKKNIFIFGTQVNQVNAIMFRIEATVPLMAK